MSAYRRIVVGTDGSDSAWRALHTAVSVAEATGAEVIVTHAFRRTRVTDPAGDPRDLGASLLRDAATFLGDRCRLRTSLEEGEAAEAIVGLAAREGADLIVVGNRGLGTRRVLMGTIPGRVAFRAPCDVLIAHTTGGPELRGVRRVLLTTDGSETASRAVVAGAALAADLGAEVEILRVGPAGGAEVLRRAAASVGGHPSTHSVEGEPAPEIVRAAGGADLVVVGNRGMTGARRFLASVPSRVARRAPAHVLLVKTT